MSKFQIVLLVFFGLSLIIAVAVFAVYRGNSSSQASVTIWGNIPSENFNQLLQGEIGRNDSFKLTYTEKLDGTLVNDFTEALARGAGPDLIILSQDQLYRAKSKLVAIPYKSISERDFKETFAEEGEIFLSPEGILALPLAIDPLVLYYNRDILNTAGIAKPLSYWDEIYAQAAKLTLRDGAGNITQSTIALGETRNIANAKEILSLLMMQAGTPIIAKVGTQYHSLLLENLGQAESPAEAALNFYTQFANPSKLYYSWNRTQPEAQTAFAAGDVAYYIGFAHELSSIRNKAPTLNLGIALMPQSRVSGKAITFGNVRGVAITRGTKNVQAALSVAGELVKSKNAAPLSAYLALPPARRDLLSGKPSDATLPVFYDSALQARSWLDPSPEETRVIFTDMIDSVTSGRTRSYQAISEANRRLDALSNK